MVSVMEQVELAEAAPGVDAGPGRVKLDGRLDSTALALWGWDWDIVVVAGEATVVVMATIVLVLVVVAREMGCVLGAEVAGGSELLRVLVLTGG